MDPQEMAAAAQLDANAGMNQPIGMLPASQQSAAAQPQ
eukprot:CAMPEP_0178394212 /NCGR_PEP_ID=MMETSP0689_2-20121128/12586_1 /TAXON_ID=160604 /ORGANISM="Amphidinium massartii, Strain CS-259" /LENGTH=37 /DNA_ID= /DNA_START= /DNA_END= /DNA_ORIENTATION=